MKATRFLSALTLLLTMVGAIPSVIADSKEASCVVRREGSINDESSGPCTFSQHQGYIDIDLKNGNTISLHPGEHKDHFKDKHGMKVVRSYAEGGIQEFKWDDRKITVTFDKSGSGTHGHQSSSGGQAGSQTPPELRDLVGARAGQAEEQVRGRGYTHRNTETSGSAKYSNWRENSTGRCVLIRTEDGRYAAISYVTEIDCRKGEPEHGGGAHTSGPKGDAKVAGTDFHATGDIPCARTAGQPMSSCKFGVIRKGDGSGSVKVFWPDGGNRVIYFEDGKPSSFDRSEADGGARIRFDKNADLFIIRIGDQRFEIPEAVIFGG